MMLIASDALYNSIDGNAWPGNVADPAAGSSGGGCVGCGGSGELAVPAGGGSNLMGDGVEATVKVDRWLLLGLAALLGVYLYFASE